MVLMLVGCGPRPVTVDPSPSRAATTRLASGPVAHLPSVLHRKRLRVHGLVMGHDDAPVKIDHFTDFACPYCARVHQTLVRLARRYPSLVRLQHHDFPLDASCNRRVTTSFHPDACRAARFARCAGRQGKFWEFASEVFRNQIALGQDDLVDVGRQLGLDLEHLTTCVMLPDTQQAVDDDVELGIRLNVTGTPTSFIAVDGRTAETVVGGQSDGWWERKVEQLIGRGR